MRLSDRAQAKSMGRTIMPPIKRQPAYTYKAGGYWKKNKPGTVTRAVNAVGKAAAWEAKDWYGYQAKPAYDIARSGVKKVRRLIT